jgi:hypothetical protein
MNMQSIFFNIILIVCLLVSPLARAQDKTALSRYLAEPENISHPWVLNNKQHDEIKKISMVVLAIHWPTLTIPLLIPWI